MDNLDQQRAKYAWETARYDSDFKNLAKGAPALIMGNGLMPTLSYLNQKGKKAEDAPTRLLNHILSWLFQRGILPPRACDFSRAMPYLTTELDSKAYLQATEEVLNLLRWTRQFAGSVEGDSRS